AETVVIPVTFPPGRGRLATNPRPTGSPVSAMTIGISRVACLATTAVGVNQVTMISTLRRTSLGGQFGKPVEASIRRSKLKSNVLPLHIPQIVQPLPKHPPKLLRIDIANDQCANGRQTFACCARAASGHATAAPPSAASNSRRPMVTVIRPSRARCVNGRIPRHGRAVLQFKEGRMLVLSSASGSEAVRLRTSKCFPGCPRKRTSPPHHGMSCECQYATSGASDGGLSVVVHLGQCDAAFAR